MEGLTRESVRPLLDLQRLDSAIDRLRLRQAELPEQKELDEFTAALADARKTQSERDLTFGGSAREAGRLEAEVTALEDKIKHESERLYSGGVTSPKELSSIQAELDGLRRRKSHVEDQLLDVMESKETAEKSLNEIKENVERLEREVAEATERRDHASTEIAAELERDSAEREAILPQVPEEVLDIYQDLRPKKDGVAVAALEGGVCRGCMVALSPSALDVIRRSGEALVRCENCRRLLIVS